MNRRRLFGIDCALAALALALAAAAPPVRAQLLPLPLPVPVVNLAPVVIAGLDQVITLPGSANLTGVAIDDGQPNPPGVLTTTWSPVSGPGTVSFSNVSALNSTATFSESGAYVLRLTVSDGALAVSDDVAVTVNPAPPLVEDKIDPALRALMQANPLALLPVIVEMQQPLPPFFGAPNVNRALEALDLLRFYGVPVAALSLIDAAAGFANATGIGALSLAPAVASIHHDATVGPRPSAAPPESAPSDQVSGDYPRVVKATNVWQQGTTGRGVTVAILDSGVAADADLVQPGNRILASVNFADQRLTSDPGGHGTHIAGIVAGSGSRSGGEFIGIAPRANVVDVRVLGSTGSGRISSVIRGIEWVLAHRTAYNIRVINLSFGAPAKLPYRVDPMSAAVEIAWRRGLVVVAASGNGGPERDTVETPGIDPYVITVGATDDRGTVNRDDDTLAWFSAWGSADSNAKPDLVAPGRRLVSLRVPGSTLDTLFPDRVVVAQNGATYFRLTGTSMATAVVSGAAALLLQRRPSLTPDQVKALLVGTTQSYGRNSGQALPDPIADGSGLLDAYAAANASLDGGQQGGDLFGVLRRVVSFACTNQGLQPADGFSRALYPVLFGSPLRWKDPLLGGIFWSLLTWDTLVWNSIAWDNFAWDSVAWDSVAWDSIAWDSVAWDSIAWDSIAWDSIAWDAFTLD